MKAIVLAGALAAIAVRLTASPNSTAHAPVGAKLDNQPIRFEANIGQAESNIHYLSHGRNADLFLTPSEVLLALHQPGPGGQGFSSRLLQLKLCGANASAQIQGLDPQAGKANYFLGNDPGRWRVNAPTFARVKYDDIYPGVDLIFYGNAEKLEYDLVVQPAADPGVIELEFEGAQKIELAPNGDLLLRLPGDCVRQRKPVLYQEIDGRRKPIAGNYILQAAHRAGFQIGEYDKSKPLIIDPVLTYSEIFGGNAGTAATSIAVDSHGNSYVTGNIASPGFFTSNSFQTNLNGSINAFVTKFDTNGAVVYSTYLGGSAADYGQGIAVDTNGDAFVTGFTSSTDFPMAHALQSTNAGAYDAFVSELNPAGNGLIYSTYLGGSSYDAANSIALDTNGNAILTGYTESTNFPLAHAAQKTNGGETDVFVTKLNTNGSALVYSTFLGGSQTENVEDYFNEPFGSVAVDLAGNAYVTGLTYSTNFPVTNAFQGVMSNFYRTAFVAMYTPSGALVRSTFLGGSEAESGNAIAVDSKGDVFVGGSTVSYDFPTKNALQPNYSGSGLLFTGDGFLTVFDPTGTNLIYSTFLGGSGDDQVNGIAIDSIGDVAVTGFTTSPDFPLLNPTQGTGNQGFFVASNGVWSASGSGLTNGNLHTEFGYFNNYNGNVVALLVDPSKSSNLYMSAEPAGVFKSSDGGSNWTAMNNGLYGFSSVSGLAFNPKDTSTLYAWGYDGVSLTTNGGTNWTSITNGLPNSGFSYVQTVAVDPNTPITLYAGTGAYGLYKSSDGGNNWSAMPGLTNEDVMTLVVDPQDPATVYAGCQSYSYAGLFQSTDFGTNWTLLGAGVLTEGTVSAIALDPTNSATIYAIIQSFDSSTLVMSTDSGDSWSNLLSNFGFTFTALTIDPLSPQTIYLGTDENSGLGVLQSTDGGQTWTPYGLTSDYINTVAVDPSNDALVYAGINGGQDAFISTVYTNGQLFFSTYLGGTGADVGNAIAVDKQDEVHVAGFTASSDFPGTVIADTALPANPRKLGGNPGPISGTVPATDPYAAFLAQFDAIFGVPCPEGSLELVYGTETIPAGSTYSAATGTPFSATVNVVTAGGTQGADSWRITSGTVPPVIGGGTVGLNGTFSQPGTYMFTISATKGGCPYTGTFTIVVTNPPPIFSSFSPSSGPYFTLVTVNGSGFHGVTSVTVDGETAIFDIINDNQLVLIVPSISAATGTIQLNSRFGSATASSPFTPVAMNVLSFGNSPLTSILTGAGTMNILVLDNRLGNNATTDTVHVHSVMIDVNPFSYSLCLDPCSILRYGLIPFLAIPNIDYTPISDTMVTFPPGSTYQYIPFTILLNNNPSPMVWVGNTMDTPSSGALTDRSWNYVGVLVNNNAPRNLSNPNLSLTRSSDTSPKLQMNWNLGWTLSASYDLKHWDSLDGVAGPLEGNPAAKSFVSFRTEENTATGDVAITAQPTKELSYQAVAATYGNTGPGAPLTEGSTNTLTNLPAGPDQPIEFQEVLTVETNDVTGESVTYLFQITYRVTVVAGLSIPVAVKVDFTSIGQPPVAPCNCSPWAGLVGGTVDGVQKVEAAGGAYGDCPGTKPTVTITGPGGVNVTYDGGQRSFNPAADGIWVVTTTVCGKTKTATITLP